MFYSADFSVNNVVLNDEETHHLVRVLRMNVGDVCEIIDGKGNIFTAKITKINKKSCEFFIQNIQFFPKKEYEFHLAIAPTKSIDRMEFMVEKCVELGINTITFLLTEHSERKQINLERIQKIAIAALKQSQQKYLPKIEDMISFKQFIAYDFQNTQCFLAHLDKDTKPLKSLIAPQKNTLILIGAEGDFSPNEILLAKNKNFQSVSLGESRLRTETAGLYANFVYKWINE
ncbi:MAG: 16S rRNA (uracil(1498)-N(3))-methyltransferase [Bacteroidetes bacterium]|nr:MAG: 16S rRNA (uracil(1498)-N(3))-methyltransferase [Bacteroidota bacterium]TAG87330.1 MAG: 16S rRNA (uracil(1498)-N(3))-methyltransferase [Bacteroidota bacterium]